MNLIVNLVPKVGMINVQPTAVVSVVLKMNAIKVPYMGMINV